MEYCFLLKILTSFKTCFVLFCQLGIRGVFRSLTVFCVFGCFGWICVKRVFFFVSLGCFCCWVFCCCWFLGFCLVFCLVLILQYLSFPSELCLQECQEDFKSKEVLVIYETSDKVANSYTPYHHEQVNGLLMKSRAI